MEYRKQKMRATKVSLHITLKAQKIHEDVVDFIKKKRRWERISRIINDHIVFK